MIEMTTDDAQDAHLVYQALWGVIHESVDAAIEMANLNPAQEEYVRTKLHDEFRFWKRGEA